MFDFLKSTSKPGDVKEIRGALLQFIKEQLQKSQGGEGSGIKGLCLYITCTPAEKHLYEAAIYYNEAERFKEDELQRMVDDFALNLPPDWTFETSFDHHPPAEAVHSTRLPAAMYIATNKKSTLLRQTIAYLQVLNGDAEKEVYTISADNVPVYIGRGKVIQTADHFFRKNGVAFSENSSNSVNRSVSRQHAHIEWDNDSGAFVLFADAGGIPPANKIKIKMNHGQQIKLHATEIGHTLQEGDQIILGEAALLHFTYHNG